LAAHVWEQTLTPNIWEPPFGRESGEQISGANLVSEPWELTSGAHLGSEPEEATFGASLGSKPLEQNLEANLGSEPWEANLGSETWIRTWGANLWKVSGVLNKKTTFGPIWQKCAPRVYSAKDPLMDENVSFKTVNGLKQATLDQVQALLLIVLPGMMVDPKHAAALRFAGHAR